MSAQHTPGPWATTCADDDTEGRYVIGGTVNALVADCYPDTSLDLSLPEQSEWRANARLIAAAPDLLAALKAIESRIQGNWDDAYLQKQGPLGTLQDDCLAYARSAIAKATGSA